MSLLIPLTPINRFLYTEVVKDNSLNHTIESQLNQIRINYYELVYQKQLLLFARQEIHDLIEFYNSKEFDQVFQSETFIQYHRDIITHSPHKQQTDKIIHDQDIILKSMDNNKIRGINLIIA